jgi:hypothetical protein
LAMGSMFSGGGGPGGGGGGSAMRPGRSRSLALVPSAPVLVTSSPFRGAGRPVLCISLWAGLLLHQPELSSSLWGSGGFVADSRCALGRRSPCSPPCGCRCSLCRCCCGRCGRRAAWAALPLVRMGDPPIFCPASPVSSSFCQVSPLVLMESSAPAPWPQESPAEPFPASGFPLGPPQAPARVPSTSRCPWSASPAVVAPLGASPPCPQPPAVAVITCKTPLSKLSVVARRACGWGSARAGVFPVLSGGFSDVSCPMLVPPARGPF